jgi:hypothetical protein
MIGIITLLGTVLIITLHSVLKDIKIELKYKNTLLEEQNQILRNRSK